ncbi:efflux RND transporter permease subunit [Desulfonema magnum]|uniref:Acriflavin resistance protein n=1 Tax=Desulfonema magnum TaxID=45655 RepID=A0A975BTX9_9BACT|nr:efflux RND transporter permease subunit [Desulfonema magnum]QTA91075.1 Acriflavin resistance protein [Desulfonema magnum]
MKAVVKFSIRQIVFINVIFVILVIAGIFSILTIPVENMPTVDIGKVFISTTYFGASAEDVEQLVTAKIEDALDGLESVEFIQSHSYRNVSSVLVKFIDDSDYKDLYDELRFRALNIKDELPAGADEPVFFYLDTHAWIPVVVVNITGNIPPTSLKLFADELKARLINLPDVQNVEISEAYDKEFHVSVDPAKLRKFGITFNQVANAVRSANTKIPTGRFRTKSAEYMLDAGKKLRSQEEVLNIVVRRDGDGNFIRVRDLVTNARISYRDPSRIPSVNGENTLSLRVIKEEQGNAVTLSEQIKTISRNFEMVHKKDGIKIVFTNDSTIEINDSVNTLGGNLILGMFLVTLLLWLTLGFRNAMLTAIGIPFAFLCTIIIMHLSQVSLNTISLFSFVLVTGIMVDDAVIIMENIFRHLQMGKTKKDAVTDGTAEVMLPVITSALTTVLAFLPMLIMSGSTGEFFAQIPKTVAFALVASLFEALFILPIHVLDWGPKRIKGHAATEDEDPYHHLKSGLFSPLWKLYRWTVTTLLNHKIFAFSFIIGLFLVAMTILVLSVSGIMPLIKVEFFPGNYFRYHVTIALPVGTAIEKTDIVVRDISDYIMSLGEDQAQSALGSAGHYEDEDYQNHTAHYYGQIIVTLPEEKERNFPENPEDDPMIHLDYIRDKLKAYIAQKYSDSALGPVVRVFPESDGPPTGKPVNIRVTGFTIEDALKATDTIMAYMRTEPELADLTDLDDDRPDFHKTVKYQPRQETVFEYGLLPGNVTALVAGALNGHHVGEFRTIDEEVDLMVRLARKDDKGNVRGAGLSDPTDILDVPVVEHSASPVLLRDLVDISYEQEATVRSRYKGKPTVTITSDIKAGAQLSPARAQVLVNRFFKEKADQFAGVSISFGGEFESTSRSYTSLTFAFFIALMGIYMVLASQFNDYFQPMIIISAVPFALIGVVMGLFFTRTTFTIGSFMAVVGLAGVAVNDSLLMLDFMNTRLRRGRPLRDAVIEGCAARMRPVLITTVTTMLGLLPMAIGIPRKSISWAPMATAFVAGLSSATILALLFIPLEYEFFENLKMSFRRRLKARKSKIEI